MKRTAKLSQRNWDSRGSHEERTDATERLFRIARVGWPHKPRHRGSYGPPAPQSAAPSPTVIGVQKGMVSITFQAKRNLQCRGGVKMVPEILATLTCGIFAGAALYIN